MDVNGNIEKVLMRIDHEIKEEGSGSNSDRRVRFTTAAKTQDTEDKLFRAEMSE